MSATRSTCPYCGVGCGVLAESFGDTVQVTGDTAHPANGGRLCAKGSQLAETLKSDDRLSTPTVDGQATSWETALDVVASKFKDTIDKYGPDSVAFYVSGQLLTEDYYVANKLMKGAIGSANIDTNSRLCMASSVVAHKRAFGTDTVPVGYDDIEAADLVILVGSNLAWCHPVLHQRLQTARAGGAGPTVVVIDPRETATATDGDLHLPLRPGTDTVLFNGLLSWLDENELVDRDFLSASTEGYAKALLAAREYHSPAHVAERCGLNLRDVEAFYRLFARTPKTVSIFSQGVNQSSVGTDKAGSIINVHLATGRIGTRGAGPFSITGQPNAMGGREVGGLANQLAAHMDFEPEDVDRVRRFWGYERIADQPGLKAVDMFDAIRDGRIRAIWIMGTNPAVSMPRANDVRLALETCDFVAVSDCVSSSDTAAYADVLLPACGWGEKDGTVTNSERCISRQRAFIRVDDDARPDWWIINEVAARMGYGESFPFTSSADIFREHAALSAFENDGSRDFDIGALQAISDDEYDALDPVYWPYRDGEPPAASPIDIFAGRRFFTGSGKARLVTVRSADVAVSACDDYPLLLNSGRIRDQWHTMTRTGIAAKLNQHTPEPLLSLHPLDARRFGIADGQLADIESRHGDARMRVCTTRSVQPGNGFVPMHWSDRFASASRAGALFEGVCDPLSGQPELKSEPVKVQPASCAWHGLLMTRPAGLPSEWLTDASYRVHSQFEHCEVSFLGFDVRPDDWIGRLNAALPAPDRLLQVDGEAASQIVAGISGDRLEWLALLGVKSRHRDAGWLARLFAETKLSSDSQQAILRGLPGTYKPDVRCGETVCACFGTSRAAIVNVALDGGVQTTDGIGAAVKAGSNCGSCLPEIRHLLDEGINGS
ncbi:MAG: molybdopterin-dependent oxidoreductase [Pseudomonadota bacterium]